MSEINLRRALSLLAHACEVMDAGMPKIVFSTFDGYAKAASEVAIYNSLPMYCGVLIEYQPDPKKVAETFVAQEIGV